MNKTIYHKECREKLSAKCEWEHMSGYAVLKDWPNIMCTECVEKFRKLFNIPDKDFYSYE